MQEKKWYKSKGVLGAITVISVVLAQFIGVEVTEIDLVDLLEKGTIFAGAILAMYGRLTAKTKII
jgi:hypothetical protein